MAAVIKSSACDFVEKPRCYLKGWLRWSVKRKMSHPENRYGNTKTWLLSFLFAAVEATMNLRGPRIEIWASPG